MYPRSCTGFQHHPLNKHQTYHHIVDLFYTLPYIKPVILWNMARHKRTYQQRNIIQRVTGSNRKDLNFLTKKYMNSWILGTINYTASKKLLKLI